MKVFTRRRQRIATGLLVIIVTNLLLPNIAWALTSGPAQPESQGFQPAGVSDMVDLQTGDFKYNIPLLDIDGYPINLNYQSGTGIDDEASWVGLGWNLNVGSINRQLRGVADDMQGDVIETGHETKPQITVGGRVNFKAELFGFNNPLTKVIPAFKGEGTFSIGLFNDNYTGLGAEIGINPGISLTKGNEGAMTASLGLGLMSNTSSGVDVSPYMNFNIKKKVDDKMTGTAGLSASLGYNTRSGMKGFNLGASYGYRAVLKGNPTSENFKEDNDIGGELGNMGTSISYNTEPVIPDVQIPYKTDYFSITGDIGTGLIGTYTGWGGMGYRRVSQVQSRTVKNPVYGFLYAEKGKNDPKAIMDFTREKDVPIIPTLPNLAIPVPLPDLFSYNSQQGSGQFRLFRGGTGMYFDNEVESKTNSDAVGLEVGPGSYFHGGGSIYRQKSSAVTRKWKRNNAYLAVGDFQDQIGANPNYQHVYFKEVGEKTAESKLIPQALTSSDALAVRVNGTSANSTFTDNAALSKIQKTDRQPTRTGISYLTAKESAVNGLDKTISYYDFLNVNDAPAKTLHTMNRVGAYRKDHHISEMTITAENGSRTVFGIPVYNTKQTEYTFAVGKATGTGAYDLHGTKDNVLINGITTEDQLGKNKGIDNYFHKGETAPFASSYLISGLLSPDYVDVAGDGITNDDPGTAIKFNYSYISKFCWRSPYQNATLNKALQADADDDKASIVYGEKELYYVHSIESKTKIAFFYTADRNDALGVNNFAGGINSTYKQKALKEIRLYSKADMSRPIKVVKFEYDYSLCPGVPNNLSPAPNNGKLTLKKIWFEYRGIAKGQSFPYKFSYNVNAKNTKLNTVISNAGYGTMLTDRWGTYKADGDNFYSPLMDNDEFPYTVQDLYGNKPEIKDNAAQTASLWHLSQIELPTGGKINVDYEADEYAYVQDKKAMAMAPLGDLINEDNSVTTNLVTAKGFRVLMPVGTAAMTDATEWFKKNYLNGSAYIYTKFNVKLATGISNAWGQEYDFVPCFSEVRKVSISSGYANILLKDRSESSVTANPIVFASWQKIKEEYPRYAYPGFDRRIGNETASQAPSGVLDAILTAISNLDELTRNFYQKANSSGKQYAKEIRKEKSFVRIVKSDGRKLGGGLRVKRVIIDDAWTDGASKKYGQAYNYDTQENGQTISSGVASYEPAVGNDENPLKQPLFYIQKTKGALGNLLDLEEPFGESYYPAPSVVYGKVTVSDLNNLQQPYPNGPTGYVVNEFYTARDFPVRVRVTDMQRPDLPPKNKWGIVGTTSIQQSVLSQGYAVELNDMHGKLKATKVFNQAGAEIASRTNYYNTAPAGGTTRRLRNQVTVVNSDGSVDPNRIIGRDVEFFTDFREQESINSGESLNVGVDVIPAFGFPLPLPHAPWGDNTDYKLFRSACAVKLTQYYGIVDSVVVKNNGSSIRTENLAYDAKTGQPVVTRTQNEFNKDIYSLKVPAYWAYEGMAPASRSAGMLVANLKSNASGELDAAFTSYLNAGDEFIDMNNSQKYWIVPQEKEVITPIAAYLTVKMVMDRYGNVYKNLNVPLVKVIRSGSRNLLDATITEMTSLNNPIVKSSSDNTYSLALDRSDLTGLHVLNVSAKTFDENWNGEAPDIRLEKSSDPYDFTIFQGYDSPSDQPEVRIQGTPLTGTKQAFWGAVEQHALIGDSHFGSNRLYKQGSNGVMGIYTKFYVPRDATYFVGYDAQSSLSFAFLNCDENDHWFERNFVNGRRNTSTVTHSRGWKMETVTLKKGWVTLQIEITNAGQGTVENGVGIEVYDNAYNELSAFDTNLPQQPKRIFSTHDLIGSDLEGVYTIQNGVTSYKYRYTDLMHTGYFVCKPPVGINPYNYGFKGNWRSFESKVFQQNRVYANLLSPNTNVIGVKDAGYLNKFYTYWSKPDALLGKWQINPNYPFLKPWITANTVLLYDKYGQELENVDALGRYSAAKFDFNGELPGAVANNAMNREIYANSFEDNFFGPGSYNSPGKPRANEFLVSGYGSFAYITSLATNAFAHSGKNSIALKSDSLVLNTITHTNGSKQQSYLTVNYDRQFIKSTNTGFYTNGFEPRPGRDYLFNVWVKDDMPTTKSSNLKLLVNGTPQTLTCKALVEDWKLLEGIIKTPNTKSLNIGIYNPGSSIIYLDDLRIHPFNANMKTYSYDAASLRLMAELDENAFATFYEYDSEGQLARVKKETERGIMTIKESRSSKKKN